MVKESFLSKTEESLHRDFIRIKLIKKEGNEEFERKVL